MAKDKGHMELVLHAWYFCYRGYSNVSYPISSTGHLYVLMLINSSSSMLFILHRCLRMDAVKSEVVAEPINCGSMTILHFCPDLGTTYHPYLLS